ncbi:Crp/Fnr family transcriptional regulator [Paenibacillus glycanilyticus]|uniref:Crp/Fnr family transcriptional regulator n=1 Tax=Paenibacillus glycanilyticus TaxID=126569 RepID=UPI00203B6423|nr:Crp/Fnr family transcriptional regulator [Paenibacillus glycanilyticus]MCM3629105.1 Crp/Fnr family transcriptional regulator [Paenibacillus glycanilyticus]
MQTEWRLSLSKLFASLPSDILNDLDQLASITDFHFPKKKAVIQTPGSEREGLCFLIEGKLRLFKTNSAGKQYTAGILGPGSMFGESDSFSLGTHGNYIEVIEDACFCSIQKQPFEDLLLKYPELIVRILKELSTRLAERDEMLEIISSKNLRDKVLFFITKLSKKISIDNDQFQEIVLSITHQELANMIGASRESVSVVLQELSNDGVIMRGRNSILVHKEKMKHYLHRENN